MAENDIGALDQVAKAIHEAHMVEKGELAAWPWEEAAKPFYHNLARAVLTALRSTTAEPFNRPTDPSETVWDEWTTHPTDSAAKDAEIAAYREALEVAGDAINEMFRYFDGGETRGSYDGKPERAQLRKAGYAVQAALANRGEAGA